MIIKLVLILTTSLSGGLAFGTVSLNRSFDHNYTAPELQTLRKQTLRDQQDIINVFNSVLPQTDKIVSDWATQLHLASMAPKGGIHPAQQMHKDFQTIYAGSNRQWSEIQQLLSPKNPFQPYQPSEYFSSFGVN